MAIGKWISFSQPVSATSDSPLPKPVPIPCTADGKQFGLENFGNTCYANSVLQALYFCRPFRDLVIQHIDPYQNALSSNFVSTQSPTSPSTAPRRKLDRKPTLDSTPPNPNPNPPTPSVPSAPRTLFSALRALYIHISQNPADKGTIAPRAFIEKLRELNEAFRNTMHQDAHEFLNYLLNRIVEEIEEEKKQRLASGEDLPPSMNSSFVASHSQAMTASGSSTSSQSPGATFIHRIFEGILTSETRCLTCENLSSRDESFLDLSIDIEQNSSVTACLRQFSASEMLCQKEKFFCDACCDLQEAERRMKIKRLPNVLALHLKRFKYQEDVQKYIKLTYRVAFSLELRLFNTVDDIPNPDRLYELFAIVVHIGNGPNHGHYVSIIKTMGAWLVFDDETVDSIKECDIPKYFGDSNSGSAYVLYYQAMDIDLSALGLRPPTPEPVTQSVAQPEPPPVWQPTDSPVPTAQSIPPLPPGLINDSITSAVPEGLPRPPTPPIALYSAPERSPRKVPSAFLKVSLPRASTIGHGTSRGDGVLRTSRSILDEKSFPKPSLAPITIFPKEDLKSPDGQVASAVNGKDKDSDKSMMSWLRRRSKTVKSRTSSETHRDKLPLAQDFLGAPGSPERNQSTSSSSNSSKDSRHHLDSPSLGHASPHLSPFPNGKPPPLSRATDPPSYGADSRRSSASASSNTTPTSPLADRRLQQRPLPSIPASPQAPKPETSHPLFGRASFDHGQVIQRRQGRPSLRDISPRLSPKSPSRPSTSAGGFAGALPSPPLPTNYPPVPSHPTATSRSDLSDDLVGRPKSAHASYGFLSSSPTPVPPLPVSPTDTAPRRATRKLSLTAPMLGFKRREKDK